MASIHFFDEDSDFLPQNIPSLQDWIKKTVTEAGKSAGEINIIFCSDEYLHKINTSYLLHDTYTDIITFDNSDNTKTIEGDIFISISRVEENAGKFNTTFTNELHRVIIHGILHLLGYDDKTPAQKRRMREKEDERLARGPNR